MAFLDGNSCSHSCSERVRKPAAYVDPKYLAEQQQKAASTEAWTMAGISLFLGLTGRVIQEVESGEISFGSGADVEGLTEDEIKGYIDATLKQIKTGENTTCGSISEAETILENKKLELQDANARKPELEQMATARRAVLNHAIERNDAIPDELYNIEYQIKLHVDYLSENPGADTSALDALKQQQRALIEEQDKNRDIIAQELEVIALENNLKNVNEIIKTYPSEISTLEGQLKNLHKYEKQLKKLEFDTTLANYQHEDSENITDILGKLKRAKANGKTEKVKKYEIELKEALQEYVKSGNTTNKTLNNLAKSYGIKIPGDN